MDKAVENGSVDEATRVDMFVNDLVVCAKEGSDLKVASLEDIAGDSVKSFAIGEPNTVPAGKYAVQSLESAKLCTTETDADDVITVTWADSVKDKVNDGADKVGTVAQYVSGGQADLGFVYSSDIYRYDGIEAIFTVPADTHKPIKYPGAVTKDAKQAQAAADFLNFCLNDTEAQAVFAKYGFELA
jgi:molybdate transport system substrate-binding protein